MMKILKEQLFLFCSFCFLKICLLLLFQQRFWKDSIASPHFFIIVLCFITVYYSPVQGIYYGLLFGFLFDTVYTELVGIYIFAYPILVYLVYSVMKVLQLNLFIVTSIVLASIVALEYYVYGFLTLLGRTHMSAYVFSESSVYFIAKCNFLIDSLFPTETIFSASFKSDGRKRIF